MTCRSTRTTAPLALYCQHQATLVATVAVRPSTDSSRATMRKPPTG